MIHAALPLGLVATLFAVGFYGVLARRNAVLLLVGIELMLAAASLLLVTVDATRASANPATGQALSLFVMTLAAAETVVALGLVVAVFRARGSIDLSQRSRGGRS